MVLQVCPEYLSIKCINLQMLSNLPKEMTEAKVGMTTSWFLERCNLRLDFGTVLKIMKISNSIHITFAVFSCPHPLEKYVPPRIFNCCVWGSWGLDGVGSG
jgi:hypothetical protein